MNILPLRASYVNPLGLKSEHNKNTRQEYFRIKPSSHRWQYVFKTRLIAQIKIIQDN